MESVRPPEQPRRDLAILMPTYNDWASCHRLLVELDGVLEGHAQGVVVLIVDDGSRESPDREKLSSVRCSAIAEVAVLRLRTNLGHQRAICIGLSHLEKNTGCARVVIMDSDGEDSPSDVPRLLDLSDRSPDDIVFARRMRRSESLAFRAGYQSFRLLHRAATGRGISFGNFSVVPRARLKSLVVQSQLWNNYSATVLASGMPFTSVPTRRGTRYEGASKMSFVRLVVHGLSALSVFSDVMAVRAVLLTVVLTATAIAIGIGGAALRFFTDVRLPPWLPTALLVAAAALPVAALLLVVFAFLVLVNRQLVTFIPTRDYAFYVDRVEPLLSR